MAEAASCLDLKAFLFQVSLPRKTRHLFRCHVEDGTLVELTRLPMGYKAGPEILQIIITSAIAVVTTVVHRLWAAPPPVRIDVWIGNIRIAGSKSGVTLWEAQLLRNADSCHATIGEEREPGATHYALLWAQFDHTHRAVSLSDKFVRSVCAMSALNSSTVAEMEVVASRFSYLAAFLCTRLYIILFHQGSATRIIRTSPGDCAGDIPGEPTAVSGWFGREIATQHRE
ncbi:target of rapamycin (TOR) kinase 1, putative [Trypanosoma cruzi]|nr:target of rapamycin (TOR) kinase 1, putative [Trypanosoma cruzi]